MKSIENKHISINTNSPYGSYHFFNVVGTNYYIETTCYQISERESVMRMVSHDGFTIEYTDTPYDDTKEYSQLIKRAKELSNR